MSQTDFETAARWVASLVAALPAEAWKGPGLGDWDMRALVGHASRALLTVEQYLQTPAEHAELHDPVAYFEAVSRMPNADPGAVLQRGVEAGVALGSAPAEAFAGTVERVVGGLAELADQDPILRTIAGSIHLSNYLPTRTFELVVHGLDIARAAKMEAAPPREPLRSSIAIAAERAIQLDIGPDLILSLTGRATLATTVL